MTLSEENLGILNHTKSYLERIQTGIPVFEEGKTDRLTVSMVK